ncbi:MAG: N-6 DNA methylase, partial [Candidatus Sericytochromatia bacterium]
MAVSLEAFEAAATALRQACSKANSETTVASRFEGALVPLLAAQGVNYEPVRERRVVASRRRIDSQFGAVVTEYKHRLDREADWEEATAQLVDYVSAIAPAPADRDGHVGVVTDGRALRFVTFRDGAARPEHPGPLDGLRLRRYVETLVALGRRALNQEHLVEDFAAVDAPAPALGRALARACYEALGAATAKTGMLQSEWQRLFARSVEHQAVPAAHALAYGEALGLPSEAIAPQRALFALQTAYAITVKLVACRVLSELHLGVSTLRFDRLATAPSHELRARMADLEDGHLLRAYGLENLLEGDFFAWYAAEAQFTPAIARALQDVIQRLGDYEGRAPLLSPGGLGDLFRALYQRTIPPAIRHDLGEYYTPRWLAQAVLADMPAPPGWRGLDPCCGSGTFVVEMAAEVIAETEGLPAGARLRQVLGRVAGIDLNPLAVLTARVNYFLAIAAFLAEAPEEGPVEIPVYLGDAAAMPQAVDLGGVSALSYTLPTAMGPLDVTLPVSLARRGAIFGTVMREVESAVGR